MRLREGAAPRHFDTLQLGPCHDTSGVLPQGYCSGSPSPLRRLAATDDAPGDVWLHGFLLATRDDADRLDLDALDALDVRGGTATTRYTAPSDFVADTSFGESLLLVVQSYLPNIEAELAVEYVGRHPDGRVYAEVYRYSGVFTSPTNLTTLARVSGPGPPAPLVVGDEFEYQPGVEQSYGLHTSERA